MEAAVRWSSHSTSDRRRFLLVDVANSTLELKEVNTAEPSNFLYHAVARCSKLPNFSAFAWSPLEESLIALGLVSGNVSLVRLSTEKQPSESVATFKIKQQRRCNSVAFSTQNWLAVALDKTRSDVCLNIYDLNADSADPVRRLCAAELVSSVRFFPDHPQELVATTQRSYIRVYDLREGYLGGGGSVQATTRNVNNIAIDPLDQNYFASAGSTNDASVTVWDKRWMSQSMAAGSTSGAVFHFAPAVEAYAGSTIWSLRYSGQKRGRLAVCSSKGELKVYDLAESRASVLQDSEYLPTNRYGGTAWHTNRYVSQTRIIASAVQPDSGSLEYHRRVVAFDWTNGEPGDSEQGVIALYSDRAVDVLRVPAVNPTVEVTARQDLSLHFGDMTITEARRHHDTPSAGAPYEQFATDAPEDFGPQDYDPEVSFVNGENAFALQCDRNSPRLGKLLAQATVQRERCRDGYLFDCHKNAEIVGGNWQLERLWEICNRFREQAANGGMVYEMLELSYIGVSGLWSEDVGNFARRTLSPSPITKINDAIVGLNNVKDIPAFDGERTEFAEHRQLCLAVCGWKFTTETLEKECQELIDRGLYYQAIVQAVLHEYKHIALNLLRTLIRSKTIPNIGLGALLASDDINSEQQEMCLWMAADTEDPALKALLTFLSTGNWRDVMKTNYLHLGYRVALGLKYLNDTELSGFIQSETARAIKNGDLEGILLTGLSEQAMDLFQTYITRTGDLQTAVLATAFTNPRYVDDVRWEMWKETYFMQMQSWRAFNERAKFTIQHSHLSQTRDGRKLVEPAPKQITLRCIHCQSSLGRRDGQRPPYSSEQPQKPTVTGPAANAGTVCITCGRHMPRCAICKMWLGTPNPANTKAAKELSGLQIKMAKFLCFCVSCGHGFHADHARSWFGKHQVCPVPDCECTCNL